MRGRWRSGGASWLSLLPPPLRGRVGKGAAPVCPPPRGGGGGGGGVEGGAHCHDPHPPPLPARGRGASERGRDPVARLSGSPCEEPRQRRIHAGEWPRRQHRSGGAVGAPAG